MPTGLRNQKGHFFGKDVNYVGVIYMDMYIYIYACEHKKYVIRLLLKDDWEMMLDYVEW